MREQRGQAGLLTLDDPKGLFRRMRRGLSDQKEEVCSHPSRKAGEATSCPGRTYFIERRLANLWKMLQPIVFPAFLKQRHTIFQ